MDQQIRPWIPRYSKIILRGSDIFGEEASTPTQWVRGKQQNSGVFDFQIVFPVAIGLRKKCY